MTKQKKKKTRRARSQAPKKRAKPKLWLEHQSEIGLRISKAHFLKIWSELHEVFPLLKPDLELVFVDSDESKRLNQLYRKKARATDVLSFDSDQKTLSGSLVIDLMMARDQAKTYHHSLERECLELFVHGCLHLAGFDHENEAESYLMKLYELDFNKKLKIK